MTKPVRKNNSLIHAPPVLDEIQAVSPKKQRHDTDKDISAEEAKKPLLVCKFGEQLNLYFERFKECLDSSRLFKKEKIDEEGLYVHKRPIRLGSDMTSSATNAIPAAGTVFYHVVLYWKRPDGKLESFDFAPSTGSDVTANLLESSDSKEIHCAAASVPAEDTLPFLYLGVPDISPDSPRAREALAFARTHRYHPLNCNCIHFADFFVRVLSCGANRNVSLAYDAIVGQVPLEDPPMLVMLQILFMTSWFEVVDGSRMYCAYRARQKTPPFGDTIASSQNNTTTAASATAAAAVIKEETKLSTTKETATVAAAGATQGTVTTPPSLASSSGTSMSQSLSLDAAMSLAAASSSIFAGSMCLSQVVAEAIASSVTASMSPADGQPSEDASASDSG